MKTILILINCFILSCLAGNIGQLPGYTGPEISQYTGYITVNEELGKAYFYWLVESLGSPNTDPLVFWFQGGPGCSGLGGLFTENGPYLPNSDGGVDYNPISWTQVANVVFLEQPAGVGFSYSNDSIGYNTNDTQAALDNFAFVEGFIQAYPQYKGRSTWLTGESYAGVYIPTLTSVILENPNSLIYNQLSGFTAGNPVITCISADYNAIQMDLFYYHALVSHIVYSNWTSNECDYDSSIGICDAIFNDALTQIGVIFQQKRMENDDVEPSLDPDCLYQDFCTGNGTLEFAVNQGYPNGCSPVGSELSFYLNRKDVQEFIGAKQAEWFECNGGENLFNYTILGNSMIPHYLEFFAKRPDLKILVYSGDVDIFTVPFGYTKACLAELAEEPIEIWQPWFVNGATAGYVESFPHYTYATVKGGGHETPQYQPLTSFQMFERFITYGNLNTELPTVPTYKRRTQARVLKEYRIRV